MNLYANFSSSPLRLPLVLLLSFCLVWSVGSASAVTKDLKADFYTAADGSDYRPAFARAFAALRQGDVLTVSAGTYYVQLTEGLLGIPAGVTVRGTDGQSILSLGNAAAPIPAAGFWSLFKVAGTGATVEGLTIQRAADFKAILLIMAGSTGPQNMVVISLLLPGRATKTNFLDGFRPR